MRALYASDLHGHVPAYEALFGHAVDRGVDAVILGGDLFPHPHRADDLVAGQLDFARSVLRPLVEAFARQAPRARVLAIPGNDDWAHAVDETRGWQDVLPWAWIDGRREEVAGVSVVGAPWVPVTPFFMADQDRADRTGWTPAFAPPASICTAGGEVRDVGLDEILARPSIEEELARLAPLSDPSSTVYVVHTPPQGSLLDVMRGGVPIGSGALRAFVERHQPPLTLHGHVHESPMLTGAIVDRIGATVCVNLGGSLSGLRAAEITWTPGTEARVDPLFPPP